MLPLSMHQHKKGIKERQPDIKITLKMSHEGRFLLTHKIASTDCLIRLKNGMKKERKPSLQEMKLSL